MPEEHRVGGSTPSLATNTMIIAKCRCIGLLPGCHWNSCPTLNYQQENRMSWTPLNEVYFVRPNKVEGSHLIPEHLLDSSVDLKTGVITHRGTGTLLESNMRAELQAKVGDTVLFGSKVGTKIKVDGEDLLMLAEANILAVKNG